MTKKVIVVGAGVTGLSAAIYARLAGHDVTILEKCPTPGGLSFSWKRAGYLFEGCVHWLLGSTPVMRAAHERWLQTGAITPDTQFHFKDPIFTYVRGEQKISLWRDFNRFCTELLENFPQDSKAICRLRKDVHICSHFFGALGKPYEWARRIYLAPAFLCVIARLLTQSNADYAAKFRTPALRELFSSIIYKEQGAISLIYTLMGYAVGDGGYPEGGSSRMVKNMAGKAESLGCNIICKSSVEKVCTKDGRVCGVVANGRVIEADDVIVTSNTLKAIDKLFDEPINERWARKMRTRREGLVCMFLSLGVEADLGNYPDSMYLSLKQPLSLGGHEFPVVKLYNYSWQKGYAPQGHSTITMIFTADTYDWWKKAKEEGRYEQEKQAVTAAVIAELEQFIPECKGKVAVTDLATPLTYERYCDCHRGEWMTVWRKNTLPPMVPAECRSIKGLHFAGHRTILSGGLPVASMSGRKVARSLGR